MPDYKKTLEHCSDSLVHASGCAPILTLLPVPSAKQIARSVRVAILVGEGVDATSIKTIYTELLACGAEPWFIGCNPGKVAISDNINLEIEVFTSLGRRMLFEAIVIPDGELYLKTLEQNALMLDVVRQHYGRCKPILAIGAASFLLAKADVFAALPSGLPDPSILIGTNTQLKKAVAALKKLLLKQKPFSLEQNS